MKKIVLLMLFIAGLAFASGSNFEFKNGATFTTGIGGGCGDIVKDKSIDYTSHMDKSILKISGLPIGTKIGNKISQGNNFTLVAIGNKNVLDLFSGKFEVGWQKMES